MKTCQNCIHRLACDDADPKDCAFFANINDYQKVVHAKWSWYPNDIDRQKLLCTNCGKESSSYEVGIAYVYEGSEWCPHCGAKMDLE